jgi:hypothetical protein
LVHLNLIRTNHDSHFFFDVGKIDGIFLDSSSAAKVLEGLDAQHLAFAAIVSERSSAALKRRSR